MHEAAKAVIEAYYTAFNEQDVDALLDLFSDDVVYDVNQGQREVGKAAFARYIRQVNSCYREHIYDIEVMVNEEGTRAAAEYTVLGIYLSSDQESSEICGQTYRLQGGAFFEICDGLITRFSSHYNMQDWQAQHSLRDSQLLFG